jgi:hypothetical protein
MGPLGVEEDAMDAMDGWWMRSGIQVFHKVLKLLNEKLIGCLIVSTWASRTVQSSKHVLNEQN